jgi:thiamine biosynthesis lipoprotein ApbE
LENESISTSGNYKRKWKIEGEDFHHILKKNGDGNPETDLISASIISKNGALSDAFATTLMTMSSGQAQKFCQSKNIKYFLITKKNLIIKNI